MEVSACPRCAEAPMALAGLHDGGWLTMDRPGAVCQVCGFLGQPLVFSDRADYAAFRDQVRAGRNPLGQDGPDGPHEDAMDAEAGLHAAASLLVGAADELPRSRGSPITAIVCGAVAAGLVGLLLVRAAFLFPLVGLAFGDPVGLLVGGFAAVFMVAAVRLWRSPEPV